MKAIIEKGTTKTITTHYIDGAFVESHGREVMDVINPTNREVIARVTLGDEEDSRRAVAAAKRAFASFGRSTKEERAEILRQLHEVVSARVDDLTTAMVEEYGGTSVFCRVLMEAAANVFLSAEKALQELPLTRPRAILFITGTEAATISMSKAGFEKAAQPKEWFEIPGATHHRLYDDEAAVGKAVAKLKEFFGRSL